MKRETWFVLDTDIGTLKLKIKVKIKTRFALVCNITLSSLK